MPFATAPIANSLHVNTAPWQCSATPAVRALPSRFGRVFQAPDNIGRHRWPEVVQRALAPRTGTNPSRSATGDDAAARPSLRAYLDQYNGIMGAMPRSLSPSLDPKVLLAFDLCRDAVKDAVTWRETLENLEAGKAEPAQIALATRNLKAASIRGASMIAQLRRTLDHRLQANDTFACVRALMIALIALATIVTMVFPPAALICCGVAFGATFTWIGMCGLQTLFGGDRTFEPTLQAMDGWARNLPPELVEGEQRLKAAAMAAKAKLADTAAGNAMQKSASTVTGSTEKDG